MNKTQSFLIFGLASVLLSACQPSFYRMSYQPEPNLNVSKTRKIEVELKLHDIVLENFEDEIPLDIQTITEIIPESIPSKPSIALREKPKTKKRTDRATWKETLGISTDKKPKKAPRKPLFKPNNDGLWIGTGLLGIAMLLTIINFPTLALLFGLVSLLFLIFGIKKLVRRNRRRQRVRSRRRN